MPENLIPSDPTTLLISTLVVGGLLLIAGRRMFWLALGVAGFAAGMLLATRLMPASDEGQIRLLVAMFGGLAGVLVAFFVQKLAIGVGGFLVGGLVAVPVAEALLGSGIVVPLVFLIGGVLGALLAGMLFEAALIFVTAALGAHLIVQTTELSSVPQTLVLVLLAAVGIAIQSGGRRQRRHADS